jgi:hypothetical protein
MSSVVDTRPPSGELSFGPLISRCDVCEDRALVSSCVYLLLTSFVYLDHRDNILMSAIADAENDQKGVNGQVS